MRVHRAIITGLSGLAVAVALGAAGSFAAEDTLPANPAKPKPAMEGGAWSLEAWGNSGTTEEVGDGPRKLLKLVFMGGDKEKTAFKHLTGLSADPKGKLHVYVYASEEKPPSVAFALTTTLAYIWHESAILPLKKGWNVLEVPLDTPNWKTEATKWEFKTGIDHIDDIRAVGLIVYNGKNTGSLLVEGFSADPDEAGKKTAALIAELESDDTDKRAKAEAGLAAIGRPAMEQLLQAHRSEKTEVIMRASFALRKIEAVHEDLPKEEALRDQVIKQREAELFAEAKRRSDYYLKNLEVERDKIGKLLKESKEELARGRVGMAEWKNISEEERKGYEDSLDGLEKTVKILQEVFDKTAPPPPEPKMEAKKP